MLPPAWEALLHPWHCRLDREGRVARHVLRPEDSAWNAGVPEPLSLELEARFNSVPPKHWADVLAELGQPGESGQPACKVDLVRVSHRRSVTPPRSSPSPPWRSSAACVTRQRRVRSSAPSVAHR